MTKKNYKEGSLFSVPLRSEGFGVGLVARTTKRGTGILAYFFNKKYRTPPNLKEVINFNSHDAALVINTGDLGLINGEWEIIGDLPNWNRSLYPFPKFVRREVLTGRIYEVTYSEDDPGLILSEKRISEEQAKNLRNDSQYGYGAAEIALARILENQTFD